MESSTSQLQGDKEVPTNRPRLVDTWMPFFEEHPEAVNTLEGASFV